MNEEKLLEKGYRCAAPGPFDEEDVEKCYHKCFSDDKGKKYFITVYKFFDITHPKTGEVYSNIYEYNTQIYQKDTHEAMNVQFIAGWEIEAVEEFMEKMFRTGLYDYYELF